MSIYNDTLNARNSLEWLKNRDWENDLKISNPWASEFGTGAYSGSRLGLAGGLASADGSSRGATLMAQAVSGGLGRGNTSSSNTDIVAAINSLNDTLRQLLTKTDRIMADQSRIRDRMDMFAQEGVTIAAA